MGQLSAWPTLCHADRTVGGLNMASVLGTSGLKTYLNDWRESRKNAQTRDVVNESMAAESFEIVDRDATQIDLSRLLENLVIPKLIAGCGSAERPLQAANLPQAILPAQPAICAADIVELTHICVREDAQALLDFVEKFLVAGNSVETIYIDLLAPAARKLGEYWEEDREDFVAVTMGLWRIQEVLRELTLRVPPVTRSGSGLRSALFSSMPGEQHSFGTLMVAEFFERAGWQADALIEPSRSELTGKFASQHYDLIGLTVSCDCSSAALAGVVTTIRTVSRNRNIKILVGGRAVNDQPQLVIECGADGTASDAPSAVALADHLVPLQLDRHDGQT